MVATHFVRLTPEDIEAALLAGTLKRMPQRLVQAFLEKNGLRRKEDAARLLARHYGFELDAALAQIGRFCSDKLTDDSRRSAVARLLGLPPPAVPMPGPGIDEPVPGLPSAPEPSPGPPPEVRPEPGSRAETETGSDFLPDAASHPGPGQRTSDPCFQGPQRPDGEAAAEGAPVPVPAPAPVPVPATDPWHASMPVTEARACLRRLAAMVDLCAAAGIREVSFERLSRMEAAALSVGRSEPG